MIISNVMTQNPTTIAPSATITQAAQYMRDHDCGVLPVSDGEKIVGMITDRDITTMVTAAEKDPSASKVSEIMNNEIISCHATDSLEKAADIMSINNVRRLVVEDENDKMNGIVSISDLMKNIGDEAITDNVMHHVLRYA